MASNALVGFWWRLQFSTHPIASDTWNYWWVCIPVVVIGAPIGARFIAKRSNLFVVRLLLTSIIIQFVTALLILPLTFNLLLFSLATFAVGLVLFLTMIYAGNRRPSQKKFLRFQLQANAKPEKIKI